jgi:replicative DNA helicase
MNSEIKDAERFLCGCLLVDAGRCGDAIHIVNGADFQDPDLGSLFDLLVGLVAAGQPVSDLAYLVPAIHGTRAFKALGAATIASLVSELPSIAHAVHYADLIRANSQRERLVEIGRKLAQTSPSDNPLEIAEKIAHELVGIVEQRSTREMFSARECVDAVLQRVDAVAKGKLPGLETGIRCVDAIAGTMQAGELVVLAARTSVGKTAFALDVTSHNASNGKRVLYFSLEMSESAIGTRLVSRQTGLSSETIDNGFLNSSERRQVESARLTVSSWELHVCIPTKPTVATIASYARSHAAKRGLDLLVVDYAGLLRTAKPLPPYERATQIVVDLKELARSLHVPILALYQPNRAAEGEMPTLAHLRDSGAIEDTADKIWFLHRERAQTATSFRVAKYRNGGVGDVADGYLVFDPDRCSYRDVNFEYANDFR